MPAMDEKNVSHEDLSTKSSNAEALHTTTEDNVTLEALGLHEELDRKFSIWSMTALVLCLMGTWEALGSAMGQALLLGGAPCLFFNYIIAFLGSLCVTVSMAEQASIWPTAGGQYHWVAALAPLSSRKTASWFTGWITLGAGVAGAASAAYFAGLQLRGLVALCDETYVPQAWHGLLFYFAILLYALVVNMWGAGPLSFSNLVAGALHIAGYVAIITTVGAMSTKQTASFVFTDVTNYSGWSNDGLAWMIGLLTTAYAFIGTDAAAHLAEEIPHAARTVPLAMVGSIIINGLLGFAYCLVLLYSITDVEELIESPTGFPFIQLFYDVTQSKAGTVIMAMIPTLIAMVGNAAALASTSRTFWAFARDGAFPFADFFSRVHPRFKIPLRMVLLVSFLEILLGLISLGSFTALNAVLSMTITSLLFTYGLPIGYMLYTRWTGPTITFGPFKMGPRVGALVNVLAIIYLTVAIFFSVWPIYYPVTVETMNWSIVVVTAWLVLGGGYYIVAGRRTYKCPIVTGAAL